MHVIRLSTLWTIREIEPGRVRFERRFGAPRLQHPNETIWLTGTAPGDGTLAINGEIAATLIINEQFEVNITALVKPRNVACIEVGVREQQSLGDVTLQIRPG